MSTLLTSLTLAGLLGSGLMAGVFFAFSTFVMRALARLTPAQGVEAMQAINRTVINPWFLGVFFGTAVISLLLASAPAWAGRVPGAGFLVAGGVAYLLGTFLVTLAGNVPLNNALEGLAPSSAEAATLWAAYLVKWTAWNHVRTVAPLLATALFALALTCQE